MEQAAYEHFLEDMVSLAAPAHAFLRTHGGITDVPSFCGKATAEFETMWENLAETAALMRVADELDWPILPHAAGKILCAFRLCLECQVRAGLNQDNAINCQWSSDSLAVCCHHDRSVRSSQVQHCPCCIFIHCWRASAIDQEAF